MFEEWDADGGGTLDMDELEVVLKGLMEETGAGQISRKQSMQICNTIDLDGGGEVEFNEFYMFLALLIVCSEGDGGAEHRLVDSAAVVGESGRSLVELNDAQDQDTDQDTDHDARALLAKQRAALKVGLDLIPIPLSITTSVSIGLGPCCRVTHAMYRAQTSIIVGSDT